MQKKHVQYLWNEGAKKEKYVIFHPVSFDLPIFRIVEIRKMRLNVQTKYFGANSVWTNSLRVC